MPDGEADALAEGTGEGLAVSFLDVVLLLTFVGVVILVVYSRLKKRAQQKPEMSRLFSIE